MAIFTSPYTLARLNTTFGSSFTEAEDFFTTYGIKWARFKPTIHSDVHHDPMETDDGAWWHASDGFCGLKIPMYTNTSEIIKVTDPSSSWEIARPVLGTNPFRLGDFAGYANGTSYTHPIKNTSISNPNPVLDPEGNLCSVYLSLNDNRLTNNSSSKSLDLSEFGLGIKNFGNMYFGVIISGSNLKSYMTLGTTLKQNLPNSDTTINAYSGPYKIDIPSKMLYNNSVYNYDNCTVWLALFKDPQTTPKYSSSNLTITNGCYLLPCDTFTIKATKLSDYAKLVINSVDLSSNGIYANVTLSVTTERTFQSGASNYFRLGYRLYQSEHSVKWSDFFPTTSTTISANSSKTFSNLEIPFYTDENYDNLNGKSIEVYYELFINTTSLGQINQKTFDNIS